MRPSSEDMCSGFLARRVDLKLGFDVDDCDGGGEEEDIVGFGWNVSAGR